MNRRLFALLILIVVITGCRKSTTIVGPLPPPSTAGVYIVNEGGFSGGGSLAYYDKQLDSTFQSIVGPTQSWVFPNDMKIVGTKGYVTVNGSDRIDIIDISTNMVVGSIMFPQFTGPGFMSVNGSSMFVANYNGSVSIIDLTLDSLLTTVPSVVGFPGGIAFANGKVFISDAGLFPNAGTFIKVLDPSAAVIVDSIEIHNAPSAMSVLSDKLYAVCSGTSKVFQINPSSLMLEDSVQLSGFLGDIATDGDFLYVLNSDSVAKLNDNPLTIIHTSFISRSTGSYFYSLSVDQTNDDVYVSNVISSGGSGQVEIYTSAGTDRRPPFAVGIFPGAFAFKQ